MGVFSKNNEPVHKVPRNTFDGSFSNSGTYQFGKIYPVFCKEVLPGDTFTIDTTFGLRFMPTAFPLQTRIRANIQYFYVRNRNLWKGWPNFIGKTGQPDAFPTLSLDQKLRLFKTGSLGDYFGLPTTMFSVDSVSVEPSEVTLSTINSQAQFLNSEIYPKEFVNLLIPDSSFVLSSFPSWVSDWQMDSGVTPNQSIAKQDVASTSTPVNVTDYYSTVQTVLPLVDDSGVQRLSFTSSFYDYIVLAKSWDLTFKFPLSLPDDAANLDDVTPYCAISSTTDDHGYIELPMVVSKSLDRSTNLLTVTLSWNSDESLTDWCRNHFGNPSNAFSVGFRASNYNDTVGAFNFLRYFVSYQVNNNVKPTSFVSYTPRYSNANFDISSLSTKDLQSIGKKLDNIEVSALPFRAYESIYNAFYRDQRNNPYVVNGVQDPNVYLPTTDGGVDDNVYDFHYANWEQDCFTSAVPSPQQGVAPLVGLTSTGVATFTDTDTNTPVAVSLTTADDADTVTGAKDMASLPASVQRAVVNMASEGISINDFRAVNSLQRWLETNMRRGFKYKDQIKSHFGVDVSYAELDMPEFIGGVTQMVNVNEVTNQTESEGSSPLGSYAGQLRCLGESNHKVNNYCDEHGFIIGLLHIVPVPCYSQTLPKHFGKTSNLDYFFPEFGHIGYQPISVGEIAPLNALALDVPLSKTFGYQRAWYDYLANFDEVHGQFRESLSPFILSRVFGNVPSLSEDFLLCRPESLNQVFTVNEVDGKPVDPVLGQIYFDVKMKRPIPRYGISKIE